MTDTSMTSHALDRQATLQRERLSSTLDDLAASLTPGRVLDEVLSYAKNGGGNFLMGLGKSAAANPIPALLISTGCAMFLSGRGKSLSFSSPADQPSAPATEFGRSVRGSGRSDGPGVVSSVVSAVGDAAASVTGSISRGAGQVGSAASQTAGKIAETARDATESLTAGARSAGDAIGGYAEGVKSTVTGNASSVQRKATLLGRELNGKAATLFKEQPLLVAAGGLLVGAALAAYLPRTKIEDQYFGDTSDSVKDAFIDTALDQADRVKSGVEHVVEKVKMTADENDLVGSAVKGVKDLGDKLKTTLAAGKDAVSEELEAGRPRQDREHNGGAIEYLNLGAKKTPSG